LSRRSMLPSLEKLIYELVIVEILTEDKILENLADWISAFFRRLSSLELCFLLLDHFFQKAIKRWAKSRDNLKRVMLIIDAPENPHYLDERQKSENILFGKDKNNEHFLNVHLDNRFSNQSSAEKCPKWHKEMATCDSSKIEKMIWDRGGCENAEETNFLDQIVHENLSAGHYVQILALKNCLIRRLEKLKQPLDPFCFMISSSSSRSSSSSSFSPLRRAVLAIK
jgi:hypothetical protein